MADESELYLENLDEFINDEDRIVTYKWLSRNLSVTSNQAKQMLFAFLTKQKEINNNKLSVTYLIGGRKNCNGDSVNQFVLVNEDKLEETKSQFQPVTSVHIYSIQKQKPKDSNSLYMVDYEAQNEHKGEENRWSHIYCKEATRLSDGGSSRASLARALPGKENALPSASSKMTNGHAAAGTQKSKPVAQKSKKGQLPTMGMFAVKSEKKPEEPKKTDPKVDKSEVITKKPDKPKPAGGMMSFFGKPTSGPAKKSEPKKSEPKKSEPKKSEPKKSEPKKSESKKSESKKSESEKSEPKKSDPQPESSVPEKKAEKSVKKEEKKPEKKYKPPGKQTRKRIKQFSSSEDEEEDPLPKRLAPLAKDSASDSEDEDEAPKKSKATEKKSRTKSSEGAKTKKSGPSSKKTKRSSVDKEDESPEERKPKKKRKRAKDVESDHSSDEESPPTTSEPSIVTETPVQEQQTRSRLNESEKRRKRQKVLHSKTYMNDEGFMVTEKVYESETTDASDEEPVEVKPEVEHKKPSPQSKATKKVPDPKSTKQASLMSFFGKK